MSRELTISICSYNPSLHRHDGPFDLERSTQEALDQVRLAASEKADLAVLPEIFAVASADDVWSRAEPLDGYVVTSLRDEAKRLGIRIAAGHLIRKDDKSYNSIVLVDQRGEVAAVYNKTYPTIGELESGIQPGQGPVVADTEFGRLGFAICYDLNFAELRSAYRDLAPDLILFCSMFRGGLQTRWWAYETRSYVVSSCEDPKSVIVNPLGRVVAETDTFSRVVTSSINLDYEVVHLDYSNKTLVAARKKYGGKVSFEWADPEGVMLVTSTAENSIGSIIDDLGWEPVEQYLNRARTVRDNVMNDMPIAKGPNPW